MYPLTVFVVVSEGLHKQQLDTKLNKSKQERLKNKSFHSKMG